ncbi:MAG TPA: diaminopimelate decarboxylase [Acidimicrobiales bacterium]|nr:diaminopimelate decarboxylase [Acidimicrobiales bacterium]
MTAIPRKLLSANASVDPDGHLLVAGLDVLDLANEFGTPLFVYDEDDIRDRARAAVAAFGDGVAYASKAFLCKAMARLAHEEGMCIDVSTAGEMHVALASGVPADRLVLHGNNKSEAELARALDVGVGRIVVDSFDEMDRLGDLLKERPDLRPRVLVRVTPGIEAHTHEYVMTGQEDSKFGFSLASGAAADAIARLATMPVDLVGLHSHIGSQIFMTAGFEQEVVILADLVKATGVEELCIGGGLGVAYMPNEEGPTIAQWGATVKAAARRVGIDAAVHITAEPGRAIVGPTALTLYRVGTIKELAGIRTYVAVDGGMSDNPRPVLYGSGYDTFLPRCVDADRDWTVTLVGKHCESGDVIVRDARVPIDMGVGDIIATPVTGAYGYSMASNYNKVTRPAVVFVRDGVARVVVRRETLDDLLRLDQ